MKNQHAEKPERAAWLVYPAFVRSCRSALFDATRRCPSDETIDLNAEWLVYPGFVRFASLLCLTPPVDAPSDETNDLNDTGMRKQKADDRSDCPEQERETDDVQNRPHRAFRLHPEPASFTRITASCWALIHLDLGSLFPTGQRDLACTGEDATATRFVAGVAFVC